MTEATDYISHMNPKGPWNLSTIHPDTGKITSMVARTIKQADKFISENNGVTNLYWTPNPVVNPSGYMGRCANKDYDTIGGYILVTDIDVAYKGGETNESVLKRLMAFSPRMTGCVATGGGLQPYWKLSEHTTKQDIEAMNYALLKEFGGDKGTYTIERLCRLPGTVNLPNAKKREAGRVATAAYVAYQSDDLVELFEPPRRETPTRSEVKYDINPALDYDMSDYPLISDATMYAIEFGHRQGREGKIDHSAEVFGVACDLVRARVPDDIIAAVLLDPENGISESLFKKGEDEAWRQMNRSIVHAHDAAEPAATAAEDFDNEPVELDEEFQPAVEEGSDSWAKKNLMSLGQRDIESVPDKLWLLQSVLLYGDITTLSGKGSVGKSLLAWHIAVAVVCGIAWGPFPRPSGRRRVLILSGEDDMDEVERRIAAACAAMGVKRSDIPEGMLLIYTSREIDLLKMDPSDRSVRTSKLYKEVQALVPLLDLGLVIVDPTNLVSSGFGESDNDDQKEVMKYIRRILSQMCAMLNVDHASKGGAGDSMDSVRGAGAKVNFARVVLTASEMGETEAKALGIPLNKRREYMSVHVPKNNYGPKTSGADIFHIKAYDVSSHAKAPGMTYVDKSKAQATAKATEEFDVDIETWEHRDGLLDCVRKGRPDGSGPWSASQSANRDLRLDFAVAESTGLAIEKVRLYISKAEEAGLIVHQTRRNPETRKNVAVWEMVDAGAIA